MASRCTWAFFLPCSYDSHFGGGHLCVWRQGGDSLFMKAFYDKGRVSELLKAVPIYAVLSEDIGLRGAHYVAFRVSRRSALLASVEHVSRMCREKGS